MHRDQINTDHNDYYTNKDIRAAQHTQGPHKQVNKNRTMYTRTTQCTQELHKQEPYNVHKNHTNKCTQELHNTQELHKYVYKNCTMYTRTTQTSTQGPYSVHKNHTIHTHKNDTDHVYKKTVKMYINKTESMYTVIHNNNCKMNMNQAMYTPMIA